MRATVVSSLLLLSLLIDESFMVLPVLADTVEIGKPEYEKRWKGYRAVFNVTNSGHNTDGVYDFHVSVFDVKIKRISKPGGWALFVGSKADWSYLADEEEADLGWGMEQQIRHYD